jgi:hypothetical protein
MNTNQLKSDQGLIHMIRDIEFDFFFTINWKKSKMYGFNGDSDRFRCFNEFFINTLKELRLKSDKIKRGSIHYIGVDEIGESRKNKPIYHTHILVKLRKDIKEHTGMILDLFKETVPTEYIKADEKTFEHVRGSKESRNYISKVRQYEKNNGGTKLYFFHSSGFLDVVEYMRAGCINPW